VSPNEYAQLTVKISPRAPCTICVEYDAVVSKAKGLGPKKDRDASHMALEGGLDDKPWTVAGNGRLGKER
jgi:hypothetical protein